MASERCIPEVCTTRVSWEKGERIWGNREFSIGGVRGEHTKNDIKSNGEGGN